MTVLKVSNLDVVFDTRDGPVHAVDGLRFTLGPRETLGVVGESGSGKSQAVLAIMGLLAANGRASGSVMLDDVEVLNRSQRTLNRIRGRRIAMIFQDPMTSLNPYMTIGRQLKLVLKRHRDLAEAQAEREILDMLDAVKLPQAKRRLSAYPHQFSGGMRQRVMIAAALLCRPEVLIADEPTTALDVTVQSSILRLLHELRDAFGTAVVLITHDLGIVAGNCDQLVVLEHGRIVEKGLTRHVFNAPEDDYTRRLLAAVPRLDAPGPAPAAPAAAPVLAVDALKVRFKLPRDRLLARREGFEAVAGVDLTIGPGETVGVVGESGCGKSSLARAVIGLTDASGGEVRVLGSHPSDRREAAGILGKRVQLVFQDPLASLNPRMTIASIVEEPLGVHRRDLSLADRRRRVVDMLSKVGLGQELVSRYPHELSGGQAQRVGIARALITEPELLICDEALSALDVSVQAGIVDLLLSLQHELGLAILFIAHDLAVVKRMSHRVVVMYLGRVVEAGPAAGVYASPAHPYTRALLDAAPRTDALRTPASAAAVVGEVPAPWAPPSGCAYRTRCPHSTGRCEAERPALAALDDAVTVACHRAGELREHLRRS